MTNSLRTARNGIASASNRLYHRLQNVLRFIIDSIIDGFQTGQHYLQDSASNAWRGITGSRLANSLSNHIPDRVQNAPHFVVTQAARPVNWLWTHAQQASAPFRPAPYMSPIPDSVPTPATQRPNPAG
ncbi:MAG: hypothetical protein AB7I18_06855 [Candidatus Berkiella sp.]